MLTSHQTQKRRVEKRLQEALKRIRTTSTPTSTDQVVWHNNNNSVEVDILTDNLEVVSDSFRLSSISDNSGSDKNELQIVENNVSKLWQLGNWATNYNINHNALSPLLGLLRQWMPFEGFPIDPRTLLKTDRNISTIAIAGGSFHHFGLTSQITKIIKCVKLSKNQPPILRSIENLISIKIGVDGLPISKSSNQQFWPILGKIDQDPSSTVSCSSSY